MLRFVIFFSRNMSQIFLWRAAVDIDCEVRHTMVLTVKFASKSFLIDACRSNQLENFKDFCLTRKLCGVLIS